MEGGGCGRRFSNSCVHGCASSKHKKLTHQIQLETEQHPEIQQIEMTRLHGRSLGSWRPEKSVTADDVFFAVEKLMPCLWF